MDLLKLPVKASLQKLCKERGLCGYSSKRKTEIKEACEIQNFFLLGWGAGSGGLQDGFGFLDQLLFLGACGTGPFGHDRPQDLQRNLLTGWQHGIRILFQ